MYLTHKPAGFPATLALVVGTTLLGCTDAARDTTQPTESARPAAQITQVATMTPAQVLGVHRALAVAANEEAAVAYASADSRISALTNHIADTRIAQEDEMSRIAAALGITIEESPTSRQIAAQSQRDVAALRAAAPNLDNAYINGLVLTEARALGVTDNVLTPSVTTTPAVADFIGRARQEWSSQLTQAIQIQRSRQDYRFDTMAPFTGQRVPPIR